MFRFRHGMFLPSVSCPSSAASWHETTASSAKRRRHSRTPRQVEPTGRSRSSSTAWSMPIMTVRSSRLALPAEIQSNERIGIRPNGPR